MINACRKKYSIPQVHRFWSNSKEKGNVRLYRESMRVTHVCTHMSINASLCTHLYVWGWETLDWALFVRVCIVPCAIPGNFLHPHFQIRPQATLTTAASPMSCEQSQAPWAPYSCSSPRAIAWQRDQRDGQREEHWRNIRLLQTSQELFSVLR